MRTALSHSPRFLGALPAGPISPSLDPKKPFSPNYSENYSTSAQPTPQQAQREWVSPQVAANPFPHTSEYVLLAQEQSAERQALYAQLAQPGWADFLTGASESVYATSEADAIAFKTALLNRPPTFLGLTQNPKAMAALTRSLGKKALLSYQKELERALLPKDLSPEALLTLADVSDKSPKHRKALKDLQLQYEEARSFAFSKSLFHGALVGLGTGVLFGNILGLLVASKTALISYQNDSDSLNLAALMQEQHTILQTLTERYQKTAPQDKNPAESIQKISGVDWEKLDALLFLTQLFDQIAQQIEADAKEMPRMGRSWMFQLQKQIERAQERLKQQSLHFSGEDAQRDAIYRDLDKLGARSTQYYAVGAGCTSALSTAVLLLGHAAWNIPNFLWAYLRICKWVNRNLTEVTFFGHTLVNSLEKLYRPEHVDQAWRELVTQAKMGSYHQMATPLSLETLQALSGVKPVRAATSDTTATIANDTAKAILGAEHVVDQGMAELTDLSHANDICTKIYETTDFHELHALNHEFSEALKATLELTKEAHPLLSGLDEGLSRVAEKLHLADLAPFIGFAVSGMKYFSVKRIGQKTQGDFKDKKYDNSLQWLQEQLKAQKIELGRYNLFRLALLKQSGLFYKELFSHFWADVFSPIETFKKGKDRFWHLWAAIQNRFSTPQKRGATS